MSYVQGVVRRERPLDASLDGYFESSESLTLRDSNLAAFERVFDRDSISESAVEFLCQKNVPKILGGIALAVGAIDAIVIATH